MDNPSIISEVDKAKIAELFKTMNYSPATESDKLAKDWLQTHENRFSGYINGSWLPKPDTATIYEVCNPFTLDQYAKVCLPSENVLLDAAKNTCQSHEKWLSFSGLQRSECLYKIAENIEKNKELFALVESISSGKHLHLTKAKNIPNLIQSLNYYASYANLDDPSEKVTGAVYVVAEEYNEPTFAVSWRIGSVLASKNVVLLLVDVKTCLTAFLLAELCTLSGLPPGVLNVLPIQQDTLASLPITSLKNERIIFTGSYLRSKEYIKMSAMQGVQIETLILKRPVAIVYDSADLHSAADSILDTLFHSDSRSERSGCKVLVQASIQKQFLQLMEERFAKISVGSSLSATDMSCVVTKEQLKLLLSDIEVAKTQNFKVVQGPEVDTEKDLLRPTLICNVPTTSKLLREILGGPTIITVTFRSVKESIEMFNCNKAGADVSIWTEKLPLALEVAHNLKTGMIWINSQNLFDASAVYNGIGLGSHSAEGGRLACLKHTNILSPLSKDEIKVEIDLYGKETTRGITFKNDASIRNHYELHIGGSYKKPKGNSYKIVYNAKSEPFAYVADGSASDIHSAVSSAAVAQSKWDNLGKYKRTQVLNKAARALNAKKKEFVTMLCDLTGNDETACTKELDLSISFLHFWSNCCICAEGSDDIMAKTMVYGKVLQEMCPLGVIGIQCVNTNALYSFLQLVLPAICLGNAVVVVPNEKVPIPALKMCEIFQSSGVLGGVVNVITGCHSFLTRQLSLNMGIDAMWCRQDGLPFVYHSSSIHPKRVFDARILEKLDLDHLSKILIMESTYTKTTYMPMGDIITN